MTNTEIMVSDLVLVNESYKFHLFHKWSKWYRIIVTELLGMKFETIKQQSHCLICNRIRQRDILEGIN